MYLNLPVDSWPVINSHASHHSFRRSAHSTWYEALCVWPHASGSAYPTTVVVKTFLRHSKDKANRIAHSKGDQVPTDDLFFDLLVP
jgi:hypothetical protein